VTIRHLVLVLGDQLDAASAAFDGFDTERDAVWMAEAHEESTHVWSTKPRIAMFLAAMRHFRDKLRRRGCGVVYHELDPRDRASRLDSRLAVTVRRLKPEQLVVLEPGDHRVRQALQRRAEELGVRLAIRTDGHFLGTIDRFNDWAEGRRQLRLENFYRMMRRATGVLMDGDEPVGGAWNFDADNRKSFASSGPDDVPAPRWFAPDAVTRRVIDLVNETFTDHPGTLDHFDWPVTPKQAHAALDDFVEHRLRGFGDYQDAIWTGEPYLYHSRLSSAMNLHLLDPRQVIEAVQDAYVQGRAPINAAEGFIRQILGWREYVRGVYWRFMPEYAQRNALGADRDLPGFYWTGETDMACLRDAIGQTLDFGYAHHIQRLMVTGLYAMLLGVHPRQVHEWYLAVYVDAVEWVELPNVLGMSQYADGGVMASKPYAATGKYIQRMSNACARCRYDPAKATGEDACPFTTLYWDFLARHRRKLERNTRMSLQVRNLDRKSDSEVRTIRQRARQIKGG
jgi:deoxyribodipyrimidine photolyase-related protein